jgi:peptidoglycan/LPS O-acetylase OafA/YrhL
VEEQFYLVWPFVVMLAGEKLLARLCVAAIIGALALRLLIVNFTDMPMAAYTFAPCRMDDLAVGALVALSFNKTGPMPARSIFATAPLWWALAAALMGLMATSSDYAFTNPVFLTLGLSLFAMFFASTLAIAATSTGIVSRFLECRIFGILGKFSYGLYVFHPLVHGMVSRSLRKRSLELSPWIEFTITFSFSFGIAWLSYQAYEKQFLKLKRHFVSSRRSTHVVTALPIDVEHPIAADGPTSIRNILVSPIPETSRH